MPELVVTALLAPSRLSLKLLRAFMWSLVFSAALVAAAVYGCIALTNVLCRPRRGCCGRRRRATPACLSDPSLGEHGFLTLKSSLLRLHYVSAGQGNGPLMLFLHGFPENWFSWRYQLREFQSRFHVVAVDLRGYGPSDAPQEVDCYTTDLLMADIQDIILGLGYSKCILVAHDWGALLAWNFSIYYPSLVERMVVVSGAPMSVYQGVSGSLGHWDVPVCRDGNFPLEPQELATPTLLLWGEKDTYFELGLVGATGSRFVPGRLEAHILPGAGHWIPQSNPQEMHQYMWAFLQDLLD
ncbi:epoxide hydrolase 3 isoform X3 [Nycticebus coucang]|uniref:epoxide hydrolase 3 isoform X3 n=1 Tax=Nycticebus coucang TaxID=9470 RepID=UPI00234D857A|nr:epoxide hydrolase 3 isoform X3 [Nycticebus coucang]